MRDIISSIIDKSIITDDDKNFVENILTYVPVTFLNTSTTNSINKLLINDDMYYKNLSYITNLTSLLFINDDIKKYIDSFINNYINTIKIIVDDKSNIFLDENLVDKILNKDDMFYYKVLFYMNITYNKQVKKYKGK